MYNVLSIDIDFFVEPPCYGGGLDSIERLLSSEHTVWKRTKVIDFLERQCQLLQSKPVSGTFIRHHDQAFEVLGELERRGVGPVHLDHIDAHSDLGGGYFCTGFHYLLCEWFRDRKNQTQPNRDCDAMNLGNWLAFAAAAQIIERVQFVTSSSEYYFTPHYFRTDPRTANEMVFMHIDSEDLKLLHSNNFWTTLQKLEKSSNEVVRVPWNIKNGHDYLRTSSPDYVIVCQSPQFTPVTADRILQQIQKYIISDNLGLSLLGPIR